MESLTARPSETDTGGSTLCPLLALADIPSCTAHFCFQGKADMTFCAAYVRLRPKADILFLIDLELRRLLLRSAHPRFRASHANKDRSSRELPGLVHRGPPVGDFCPRHEVLRRDRTHRLRAGRCLRPPSPLHGWRPFSAAWRRDRGRHQSRRHIQPQKDAPAWSCLLFLARPLPLGPKDPRGPNRRWLEYDRSVRQSRLLSR